MVHWMNPLSLEMFLLILQHLKKNTDEESLLEAGVQSRLPALSITHSTIQVSLP